MELLDVLTYLVWLVASVTFIFALKFLASPQTARRGNQLGAAGMTLVVVWTFFTTDGMFENWWIIIVGGVVGALLGVVSARRVPMTAMPQMVAIFNGAGGGAAAVVAAAEFLRDGHAVARHDHHALAVGHEHRGVLGGRLAQRLVPLRARDRSPAAGPEAGEQHVDERAVHCLRHELRQDRARGADQSAGDEQRVVAQREAGRGHGDAGVGVEQRDDDRHVGAADRHDELHAQDE